MARDYTPLPFRFLNEFDGLSDEEYGRLIRAMQAYSIDGSEPELPGTERLFWKICKNAMDYFYESYDKKCVANSENGKKGGRPKKSEHHIPKSEENPKKRTVFSETPKSQIQYQVQDQVQDQLQDQVQDQLQDQGTNPLKPPKGAKRTDAEFEVFWSAYPTKVGKQPARKAFDKVKVPVETLVAAIERQKCSIQWSKDGGQYIPNPATWLNQCRWEDELTPTPETENERWKRQLDAETAEYIKKYMANDGFDIGKEPNGGDHNG